MKCGGHRHVIPKPHRGLITPIPSLNPVGVWWGGEHYLSPPISSVAIDIHPFQGWRRCTLIIHPPNILVFFAGMSESYPRFTLTMKVIVACRSSWSVVCYFHVNCLRTNNFKQKKAGNSFKNFPLIFLSINELIFHCCELCDI